MVALESTLISHGLPRPAQPRGRARDRGRGARGGRGARDDRGGRRARLRIGLDEAALEAIASRGDVVEVRGARPGRRSSRAAVTARPRWRPRRGWPRERASRVFATGGLGGVHREARETWDESADLETLARAPDHGGVRGGQVDPRRRRDARAPGDARRDRARLRHRRASPASTSHDSGFPVPWRVDTPGGGRGGAGRARASSGPTGAPSWSPTRCRVAEQLDPALHDRVLAAGLAAAADERASSGKEVTPFLLDLFHRETGGREPRGQRAAGAAQRAAGGARSPPRRRDRGSSSSATSWSTSSRGCRARWRAGSDSRGVASRFGGGGSAANVAAWLAHAGAAAALVGRVGDDAARARRPRRRCGRAAWMRGSRSTPRGRPAPASCSSRPGGERSMLPDAGRQRRAGAGRPARLAARPRRAPAPDRLRAAARRGRAPAALASDLARRARRGMSVSVDPSSAALLRARVPGAGGGRDAAAAEPRRSAAR